MKPRAAEARLEPLITDMLATYMSGWNDYSAEPGEHVILVVHETATMRDTGVPLERDLVQLWTYEGKGRFPAGLPDEGRSPQAARLRE